MKSWKKRMRPWLGWALSLYCLCAGALGIPDATAGALAEEPNQHFQSARSLQSQGRFKEAVVEFRRFLDAPPPVASPDLLRKQVEAALFVIPFQSETENQALIRQISQKIQDRPGMRNLFYLRLAEYLEQAHRVEEAKWYVRQVVASLPPLEKGQSAPAIYYDAYFRLGKLAEKSGDAEAAINAYQKVLAPDDMRFIRQRSNGAFQLANLYLRRKADGDAVKLLRALEETIDPKNPGAIVFYFRLYHFNLRRQQTAEAERCYAKLMDLASQLPELKSRKSRGGRRLAENYGLLTLAHFSLGKLFEERRDMARAISAFEEVVKYSPSRRLPLRWVDSAAALIPLYEKSGRPKEAIDAFIKNTLAEIGQKPRPLGLFLYQTLNYYARQAQPAEVKTYAVRLLSLADHLPVNANPQWVRWQAMAHFRLATVLSAEGERHQAADHYDKTLQTQGYSLPLLRAQVESAFQLAGLYPQIGRSAEVDKILRTAAHKVEESLKQEVDASSRRITRREKAEVRRIAINFNYRAAETYHKAGQKKLAERHLQNVLQLKKQPPQNR